MAKKTHIDTAVLCATVESLDAALKEFRGVIDHLTVLFRRLADPLAFNPNVEEDVLLVIEPALDHLKDGCEALMCIRPAVEELVDDGLRLRYTLRRQVSTCHRGGARPELRGKDVAGTLLRQQWHRDKGQYQTPHELALAGPSCDGAAVAFRPCFSLYSANGRSGR